MGFLLCPDDQRRALEGFVALVEVLDSSADEGEDMFEQLCAAQRTGNVHYIQRARWYDLFDRPEPATPMVFIEPGVTKKMQLRARLTLH